MKQIKELPIWKDGGIKKANNIHLIITNDNLQSVCQFYYQLIESIEIDSDESTYFKNTALTEGNISMSGEDYLTWNGSNDGAYTFIANQLNLTIL